VFTTGVWLTTSRSCLWLQTSCSSGAMLRSPTRMARGIDLRISSETRCNASDESKLVCEFRILVGIGDVAAGRDVEVMQRGSPWHPVPTSAADMPGIGLAAHVPRLKSRIGERDERIATPL